LPPPNPLFQVGPALEGALARCDQAAIVSVREELLSLVARLEALVQQQQGQGQQGPGGEGPALQASWIRASAYDALNLANVCFEQQAVLQEDAGEAAPRAQLEAQAANLARMVGVVGDVAAGSDLHAFLATKQLGMAQQLGGAGAAEARAAGAECVRAVGLRYGAGSEEGRAALLRATAEALQRVVV
jgi:hypothetical protein